MKQKIEGGKKRVVEFVTTPIYSQEDLEKIVKSAESGNMADKLNLILHNQAVLNIKLNTLLNL
jgi:hypothetical protein